MPISGTTTDYTSRTVDLNIMQRPDPAIPTAQAIRLEFGVPSSFCAGIQKLVQRYMVYFCTTLGSQDNYPAFGTSFLSTLEIGSNYSVVDVQHLFNFANISVTEAFMAYQKDNANLPLDEQFLSAKLLSFRAAADTLALSIQITSKAADSVVYVVPLPLKKS